MAKKALIVNIQNNAVEIGDCEAVLGGLRRVNFETSRISLDEFDRNPDLLSSFPIEEMNIVAFTTSFSALISSRGRRKSTFQEIVKRSKADALSMFVSDTTLPLDPHLWNKKEGHKSKVNVYSERPMRVIGSFTREIMNDEKAMKRVNSIWMNKLHPDSTFIPLEWMSFHIDFVEDKMKKHIKLAEEKKDEIYPDGIPDVNNFYYGIKKPKVAKRLLELGIGSDPLDGTFGTIGSLLPDAVRDFDTGSPKKRGPEYWAPLAQNARGIYIPYDPVKGDYQFTPRFLEATILNPDNLILDPLINDEIAEFTKVDPWRKKADEASKALDELF